MKNDKKVLFFVFFFSILFLGMGSTYCYSIFFHNEKTLELEKILNLRNISIQKVQKYAELKGLFLEIEYQYHDEILKDRVISQNLKEGNFLHRGDNLKVIVSMGKVPDSVYREYKVNELGRVPIMMYHGIVSIANQDTKYIGGNVDKDGYQRTVEAFRNDLEFYYQSGYRMIRLMDYVNDIVNVELGYSPIILTFDDGSENNFKVLGEENGELIIDPYCAVGILEEFKKKYPDYGVTATFFVNGSLFQQGDYNEKIIKWLVEHGYDIGNHTWNHVDFTKINVEKTQEEVGKLYQYLDTLIPKNYVSILALPFGSPYKKEHDNYQAILNGEYSGFSYVTKAILRVGWESEVSCFSKEFQPLFLKRIRAYDNNGKDFDIEYNFKNLEDNRYISDGDSNTIVVLEKDKQLLKNTDKKVKTY